MKSALIATIASTAMIFSIVKTGIAQESGNIIIDPPEPGQSADVFVDHAFAPGVPFVAGLNFAELMSLVGEIASKEGVRTRGPREISIYRKASPGVVLIKTKEGSGSGVVLPNGLIVTNRHVVEGFGAVQIFFKPSNQLEASRALSTTVGTVRAVDPSRDLALIKPSSLPSGLPHLKLSLKEMEVGADVFAIGHPLGYDWTFTQGLVSGLRLIDNNNQKYTAIQTQTPINPGNSGGPLLNSDGEVVGINTWARDISSLDRREVSGSSVTIARPAQGLNFAVSAKDVQKFIEEVDSGKIATMKLEIDAKLDCMKKPIFTGKAKDGKDNLRTFSMRCDGVVDAWQIIPAAGSEPIQFHLNPERGPKSAIVILSDSSRKSWSVSYWDYFKDCTFAVTGSHEAGGIHPTKFEFSRRRNHKCS